MRVVDDSGASFEVTYTPYENYAGDVVQTLHYAFLAGQDLGSVIPDIDRGTAYIIVAETWEADRMLALEGVGLLETAFVPPPDLSDLTHAALAEVLFIAETWKPDNAARTDAPTPESALDWGSHALTHLSFVLDSPTASPTLWYEGIYRDVAEALWAPDPESLSLVTDYYRRGLAHNLAYSDGDTALAFILELANTAIASGEADRGLQMYAELLLAYPSNVWIYNSLALALQRHGFIELGIQIANRGLTVAVATDDPDDLYNQLVDLIQTLGASPEPQPKLAVSPMALEQIKAALKHGWGTGENPPVAELAHELVPDLDDVPVKRPLTPDDVVMAPPADLRPRRNAPCWCGSGRKYKHCHAQSDRKADLIVKS